MSKLTPAGNEIYTPSLLGLLRCPHCGVNRPLMMRRAQFASYDHTGKWGFVWAAYSCASCGMGVLAGASANPQHLGNELMWNQPGQQYSSVGVFPGPRVLSDDIPGTARKYLEQGWDSLHAPDGAVLLAASSIDAMLKEKGYTKGGLSDRIDEAAENHVITKEMASWAHDVRLDANDVRHADTEQPHHEEADARRVLEFATTLAEVLFVIPERVKRGRKGV